MAVEPVAVPEAPAMPREFRGVWIATVDNIDWPSRPGLPPEDQKAELQKLLRLIASLRFNAVVFQVRPSADALYVSGLEPTSWYLTGKQGSPITFDPLQYAVEEGHRLGLEVHAWFNPFRACHPAQKGPYTESHVSRSNPDWVKSYAKYQWLDPGHPEARDLSFEVFMDVVQRYDIDGVHIDDYFYPYPDGGQEFPDSSTFSSHNPSGITSVREWRRANVDSFVQRVHEGIKERKPWVKFGISPFGIYRPNVPVGIKAGLDQYEDLSADALKWLQMGWCDYMSPQLYWKIESSGQPFNKLLNWWTSVNVRGRHIWPGLYTSLLNKSYSPEEVSNQIKLTRKNGRATGQVHFSAVALTKNYKNVREHLSKFVYQKAALVPPSPWMGSKKPPKPMLRSTGSGELSWAKDEESRFFVVSVYRNGKWHLKQRSSEARLVFDASDAPEWVTVTPVSRTSVAGETAKIRLRRS